MARTPKPERAPTPPGADQVPPPPGPALQPNMLIMNGDIASSTLTRIRHDHSVISESRYLNCLFHETNFESSTFAGCTFDGGIVVNSSLRGVELRNCDVEGLVVNGVNIGELLKQFAGG